MVDPSDLEALLAGGGGDDDEGNDGEGEGLQHHAGADKALGALLGLKKSGRKKGALEAQRQGYQIRLRALDLLEVGEGEDRRPREERQKREIILLFLRRVSCINHSLCRKKY